MKYIKAFGLLLVSSLFISNIQAAPERECVGCNVVLIDSNGEAWGKEGASLCRIPKNCSGSKKPTTKTVETKTVDTKTPDSKSKDVKTQDTKVLPPAPASAPAEPNTNTHSNSNSNTNSNSNSNTNSNSNSNTSSNSNSNSNSSSSNNSGSNSNYNSSSNSSSNTNYNSGNNSNSNKNNNSGNNSNSNSGQNKPISKTRTATISNYNNASTNGGTKSENNLNSNQAPSRTLKPAPVNTSGPHQTNANGNMICNGCTVTATGGDNSLWGWEDENSCVIDENKCNVHVDSDSPPPPNEKAVQNHKKDSNGNLICNLCEITATGNDKASYWGWEDDASCIIDKVKCRLDDQSIAATKPVTRGKDGILICSFCEATETHADHSLWSVENGEICKILGSRCNINHTKLEWCKECSVTATGDDGALYGWENLQSCIINEQTCDLVDKTGKPVTGSSFINIVNSDQYDGAFSQKASFTSIVIASLIGLVIINIF